MHKHEGRALVDASPSPPPLTHTHTHTLTLILTHTHPTLPTASSVRWSSCVSDLPRWWTSSHDRAQLSSWNDDLADRRPAMLCTGSMLCHDPILCRQPSRCRPYVSHRWHWDWSLQENVTQITTQGNTSTQLWCFSCHTVVNIHFHKFFTQL